MLKELGLSYIDFLIVPLFIHWDQFIIVQVALPTPYHEVPSNSMLVFKRLPLNLLNIVIFFNPGIVIGYHPTGLKKISAIFKLKLSESNLTETGILLSQMSVRFQNKIFLRLFIRFLVVYLLLG